MPRAERSETVMKALIYEILSWINFVDNINYIRTKEETSFITAANIDYLQLFYVSAKIKEITRILHFQNKGGPLKITHTVPLINYLTISLETQPGLVPPFTRPLLNFFFPV